MNKPIFTILTAIAVVVSPLIPTASATSGGWKSPTADAAWDYVTYHVERLALDSRAQGPFVIGEHILVAEPADSCVTDSCALYDVTILRDGLAYVVRDQPAEVFDAVRYTASENHDVYLTATDTSGNRYRVSELNLDSGAVATLLDNVVFTNAANIDVRLSESGVYFNAVGSFNAQNQTDTSGVYLWSTQHLAPDALSSWTYRVEHLLDINNGKALVKLEFDTGNKQLWLYDTTGLQPVNIPNVWTEANADIVAARLLDDGALEFFMNYIRYTYDAKINLAPVKGSEQLNWYRPIAAAVQTVGSHMAWVDPSDTLYVSDGKTATKLAAARGGQFHLEDDRLFYATEQGGVMYNLTTGASTATDFFVTSSSGDTVVGTDVYGSVWYGNLSTGKSVEVGYGSHPALSDSLHAYWTGVDGKIYEVTVSPDNGLGSDARALRIADADAIYLIADGYRWTIPDATTYFTWFDSWDDVTVVSPSIIASYLYRGDAPYAPGTRVKLVGARPVYIVDEAGKLHWMVNQTVAYLIYGPSWNKGIVELSAVEFNRFMISSPVESEADIQSI